MSWGKNNTRSHAYGNHSQALETSGCRMLFACLIIFCACGVVIVFRLCRGCCVFESVKKPRLHCAVRCCFRRTEDRREFGFDQFRAAACKV